jgi:hypothetical protein
MDGVALDAEPAGEPVAGGPWACGRLGALEIGEEAEVGVPSADEVGWVAGMDEFGCGPGFEVVVGGAAAVGTVML